jgi:ribosomal protein S27AE
MEPFANSERWDRIQPRLRLTERECPHCDGLLLENEKEECYECTHCGYIDCSNANEILPLAKVV